MKTKLKINPRKNKDEVVINQFKVWLMSNHIYQKELSVASGVGVTSLHHFINEGKYTEKTMQKVVDCLTNKYGKDIDRNLIISMIAITQ